MHTTHPLLLASTVALSCGVVLLPGGPRPATPHVSAQHVAAAFGAGYGEPAVPHPAQHRALQVVASRERAAVPAPRPPAPRPTAVRPAAKHLTVTHLAAPAPVRVAPVHRVAVRHVVVARAHHAVAPPAAPRPRPPVHTSPPAPAPRQTGGHDDYPYASTSGYVSDRWGFTERQCTSFVAWRLAQAGHPLNNATQNWDNASHWDDTARSLGRAVTGSPSVGTVAQWGAGESSPFYASGSSTANGTFTAGGAGHVAWVRSVYSDGSVLVEQYNLYGNESYSTMRVKAPRYLHLQ